MFKYILKRILIFIPTLFVISVFTFGLSKVAPGDPVELRMAGGMGGSQGGLQEQQAGEEAYLEMSQKLGLDIPAFYCGLSSQAYPDTLYKILRKKDREMLGGLIDQHGNWTEIESYYQHIKAMETSLFAVESNENSFKQLQIVRENAKELLSESKDEKVELLLAEMKEQVYLTSSIERSDSVGDSLVVWVEEVNLLQSTENAFNALEQSYAAVKSNATPNKKYIPSFKWYGLNNQYHVWLFGNRPWFTSKDNILDETFEVTANEQTFKLNPTEDGYYDIKMKIDIDGEVENRDATLLTITYDNDGTKRTREYSYAQLENVNFKLGTEYIDKHQFTAGQDVSITFVGKNPDVKISGDVSSNHVLDFDPSKVRGGFFRFDFGESYLDGRPVKSILFDALPITIKFNVIAVALAYFISIPLGVFLSVRKDSLADRTITTFLFILYSLPSFWIATMAVVFLTTNDYGSWTNLFPTYGLSSQGIDSEPFFARLWDSIHHMILPIACMTYGSFTYISRQMRGGMISVIKQDYIRTAKAKGLSFKNIIWKHAFRNSLIPIVTMFASIFPVMISGSVVIEVIFNLPGMGNLGYQAVVARNYPVLFTILMFSAILTMVGMLMADLLYSVVDPRISFTKKGS